MARDRFLVLIALLAQSFGLTLSARAAFISIDFTLSTAPVPTRLIDQAGNVADLGFPQHYRLNSITRLGDGRIVSVGTVIDNGGASFLIEVNPTTGTTSIVRQLTFPGSFTNPSVRSLACDAQGRLFATVSRDGLAAPHLLSQIDLNSGAVTTIAGLNTGVQGMEFSPDGILYAFEFNGIVPNPDRGLIMINPQTGAITDVNPSVGSNSQSFQTLAFTPDGRLFTFAGGLIEFDRNTGAFAQIGPVITGVFSRGMVFVPEPAIGAAGIIIVTLFQRRVVHIH